MATGRSQRLDQRVQRLGRDGNNPAASFYSKSCYFKSCYLNPATKMSPTMALTCVVRFGFRDRKPQRLTARGRGPRRFSTMRRSRKNSYRSDCRDLLGQDVLRMNAMAFVPWGSSGPAMKRVSDAL